MAVIGIDLGTSNTCVAVVKDGKPRVILDDKGRSTIPSVMSLNRRGQFFVGHMAKAQMAVQPECTIHSAKRLLGQKFDSEDVQRLLPYLAYQVVPMVDGMSGIMVSDHCFNPTEISAAILKKVKSMAEAALGEPVTRAVVSVPAHFDNFQRRETKRAAEIAGLSVMRLINEPTAAALAYGFGTKKTNTVAVYDFGGGTFDITVLEIDDGVYNVIATGGDTFLGGNDFNQAIVNWLCNRFMQKYQVDLAAIPSLRQRLIDAAEFAKIQLSTMDKTTIELPNIVPDIDPSLSINEIFSRRQLEDICSPLVERSLNICQDTFDSVGLHNDELDEIIMVGGMTQMPLIRRRVQERFGRKPNCSVNPDEAVGLGSAVQAAALENSDDEDMVLLLDVIPLTLNIESAGGVCLPLIKRNTKVPYRVNRIFSTSRDNQESVMISIYQGEGRHVEENAHLATFELSGIRPARRMEPRIEVSLKIDVNGILSVKAMDLDTRQSQSIQIVDMGARALDAMDKR